MSEPLTDDSVTLEHLRREGCVMLGPVDEKTGRRHAVVVALAGDGTPRAYVNECMHIAIPLGLFADSVLDRGTLLCGTHGARYHVEDGACFEGPCIGQHLDVVPFVVEDGRLVLRSASRPDDA